MRNGEILVGYMIYKINNVKIAIELLEDLKNTGRLAQLNISKELVSTSKQLIHNCLLYNNEKDIISYLNNVTSNQLVDQVIKYGTPHGIVGLSYDIGKNDAETIVLRLLLDENSNIRANRNLLLCKDLNNIGISCYYLNNSDRALIVITYCQEFLEKRHNILNESIHSKLSLNLDIFNNSPKVIKEPISNTLSTFRRPPSLSTQTPKNAIVKLVECDESPCERVGCDKQSPFKKVGCEELVNHIYNSERIVENIKVEKRSIRDKYDRNIIYVIKKILYTNGDYEEIAKKI
jgi:hypothetical protein